MNLSEIDPIYILINIGVLLFSLSIHESAHAWTADWLGDSTGRHLGRVTLNPLAHIDPIGSVVFPLLGLVGGGVIFGWAKPVPVNPSRLRNPKKDHILIAAAGPATNVVAALAFLICLKIMTLFSPMVTREDHTFYPLFLICYVGLFLNNTKLIFFVNSNFSSSLLVNESLMKEKIYSFSKFSTLIFLVLGILTLLFFDV